MDPRALEASAQLMGFKRWERYDELTGGRSETVVAWHQQQRYVVKAYDPKQPAAGVREQAALRALGGAAGTPRWMSGGEDPPHVVMSWLEGSGSLADALVGSAPEQAHEAVLAWAEALADVHAAGVQEVRDTFSDGLRRRAPQLEPHSLPGEFADAARQYPTILEQLELPAHGEALQELSTLPCRLAAPEWEVLSPADTCPDNNLIGADGMRLLDFEYAELRHAAWDVAYLRAPWPSCWCAWRLPAALAAEAVARYCEVRGEACSGPQFRSAIDLATLGWQVMTPAWFIPGALEDDDATRRGRPSRRAFILHRLEEASRAEVSGRLAALAGDLHAALAQRWGDVPLELAPAFRV